jgi:hypothetical protein
VIEGENPPQERVQRWGRAIGQAGRKPLDLDELLPHSRSPSVMTASSISACARKAG